MLRTIRLYGELGKKYGKVHRLHVNSVAEAVKLLSVNYRGFKQQIIEDTQVAGYEVWDGRYNLGEDDDIEHFHKHGDSTIKIIPRVRGAGNAAKILVGVVLIAAAVFATGGFAAAFGAKAGLWGIASTFGASLVLSGVIGLMTKTATGASIDSTEDNTQSYIFSGSLNTVKQGNPVFVAYGTHLLGSQVISASLTTSEVPI